MIAALVLSCLIPHDVDPSHIFPEVPGWTCTPESTVYTPANLWDLIDGAADLFVEYRFQDLLQARYASPKGEEIRVELYRHATPTDAFGMYAAERSTDYKFIEAGTQGYAAEGVLNFFCGEFYAKLSTLDTARAVQKALVDVARRITLHLGRPQVWPPELQRLPRKNRTANSEQFVRRGFLGHQFLKNVFSAGYPDGARCFIIHCASAAGADSILTKYRAVVHDTTAVRPDSGHELNDPHNGPVALMRVGADLAGVCGAADPAVRDALLSAAAAALKDR